MPLLDKEYCQVLKGNSCFVWCECSNHDFCFIVDSLVAVGMNCQLVL